jgi:hypothetical protein
MICKTRRGNTVVVGPNITGWLDKLPYCVYRTEEDLRNNRPIYTVGHDGRVYPDDHPLFKDTQEYWQPSLFGWPRYDNDGDLMEFSYATS